MVPMHAQERKEAFHEPRAKAGASSTHSKRCRVVPERLGLREAFGVRPACRRFPPFMVPMHAPKRKKALQERPHSSSSSFSSSSSKSHTASMFSRTRTTTRTRTNRFMVPMHAQERKEAFQEAPILRPSSVAVLLRRADGTPVRRSPQARSVRADLGVGTADAATRLVPGSSARECNRR